MAIVADDSDVLSALREAILRALPDLAGQSFVAAPRGRDSLAVEVGGRLIFKFPRHEAAEARLRKEARLLAAIRPRLSTPVPDMSLIEGPPLFSRHRKLIGEHLPPDAYDAVSVQGRDRIAGQLALFYAELHALDVAEVSSLGAGPIGAWLPVDEIARKALPRLPPVAWPRAEAALDAYARLPPDPHGETFGFFDGHGWNLAFEAGREQLNGVYDFGDSGFGGLHQEFIYSNITSFDLTDRIVAAYKALTGRELDRDRIDLLTGVHGLSELAELSDDPVKVAAGVERVMRWVRHARP